MSDHETEPTTASADPQLDDLDEALAGLNQLALRGPTFLGGLPVPVPSVPATTNVLVILPHREAWYRSVGAALRDAWEAQRRPTDWRGWATTAAVGAAGGAAGLGTVRLVRGKPVNRRDLTLAAVCVGALAVLVRRLAPRLVERRVQNLPSEVIAELEARAAASPGDWGDWRLYFGAITEGFTGRKPNVGTALRLPGGVRVDL